MPRVPVYDNPTVDVRPLPTTTTNVQPGNPLGQVADGLGEFGQGALRAVAGVQEFRFKANTAAEIKERAAFENEDIQPEMYNPETGLMHQKGEKAQAKAYTNAEGKEEHILYRLEKKRQARAAKMANDDQRAMFLANTAKTMAGLERDVGAHLARENRVVLGQAAQSAMENGLRKVASRISRNSADLSAIDEVLADVSKDLSVAADGPAELKAMQEAFRQQVLAIAFDQLFVKKDAAAARELLGRPMGGTDAEGKPLTVREQLGKHLANVEAQLQQAEQFDTISKVREFVLEANRDTTTGWTDSVAISKFMREKWGVIEKQFPAARAYRKQIEDEIEQTKRQELSDQVLEARARRGEALAILQETRNINDPRVQEFRVWARHPGRQLSGAADMWGDLLRQDRIDRQAEMVAMTQAQRLAKARQQEIDDNAVQEFEGFPDGKQLAIDVDSDYRDRGITTTAKNRIRELQKKAQKELANGGDPEVKAFVKDLQLAMLESTELQGSDKTAKAKRALIENKMIAWFRQYKREKGEAPDKAKITRAHEAILKQYEKAQWYGLNSDVAGYELPPEDLNKVIEGQPVPKLKPAPPEDQTYGPAKQQGTQPQGSAPAPKAGTIPSRRVTGVPDDQMNAILKFFKDQGIDNPTDAQIEEAYKNAIEVPAPDAKP